jgi:hypothetical protein
MAYFHRSIDALYGRFKNSLGSGLRLLSSTQLVSLGYIVYDIYSREKVVSRRMAIYTNLVVRLHLLQFSNPADVAVITDGNIVVSVCKIGI